MREKRYEFFLLHQAVIVTVGNRISRYFPDWRSLSVCVFLIIVVSAAVYKNVFEKPFSGILEKGYRKLAEFIEE